MDSREAELPTRRPRRWRIPYTLRLLLAALLAAAVAFGASYALRRLNY